MLESHTREIDTINCSNETSKDKKRTTVRRQNRSAALGRPAIKLLGVCFKDGYRSKRSPAIVSSSG